MAEYDENEEGISEDERRRRRKKRIEEQMRKAQSEGKGYNAMANEVDPKKNQAFVDALHGKKK